MQPQCPICRGHFSSLHIRQLHVERDAPSSTTAVPQVDTELQRLLDAIENITDGDTTVEETEGVIDQCDAYQDSQPDSNPVRDFARSVRKPTD
jgi:hypothetical protein